MDEDAPVERLCDQYGHSLGMLRWYDDAPACARCADVVARHGQERERGMTYVTCRGHRVGAIKSLPVSADPKDPRWYCWTCEPDGPLFTIGRRATRAEALATVCASHDCEDAEP